MENKIKLDTLKEFVKKLVDEYPLGDENAKKIYKFYVDYRKNLTNII